MADYIESLWKAHDKNPKLVLDLACGTGSLCVELSRRGYEMIGADLSEAMLNQARQKAEDAGQSILFLEQDMREFELYGTVAAVVCVCDSLNYLLEEEDLAEVFSLVHNYLDQNGVFIFDMNTIHKYRDLIGDATICENREEGSFIWENYFDEESSIDWLERVWQPAEEERGKDESLEELKKLLCCLSEEDKDLFFRRYVDEQPVADIAREKKTNPGRIYARISRGRKKLKHYLECQNGGMVR